MKSKRDRGERQPAASAYAGARHHAVGRRRPPRIQRGVRANRRGTCVLDAVAEHLQSGEARRPQAGNRGRQELVDRRRPRRWTSLAGTPPAGGGGHAAGPAAHIITAVMPSAGKRGALRGRKASRPRRRRRQHGAPESASEMPDEARAETSRVDTRSGEPPSFW